METIEQVIPAGILDTGAYIDALANFAALVTRIAMNFFQALSQPDLWLGWVSGLETVAQKQSLMRFIYYGGSVEFFEIVMGIFVLLTLAGLLRRDVMWSSVRTLEGLANNTGRFFAWAGLLMVLQQVVIVFVQRIFAVPQISLALGTSFTQDVSWWAEELKLYNAAVVCLCVTYTFVQSGHVRVDLIYAALPFRVKRLIDMLGSLFFMMPMAIIVWLYGWFFMWRHLVIPNPSATDTLDRLLLKARALRWNVETIGFSPNGFNAYFLFKVLLVAFAALIFLHSIAFLYRSWLEFVEGEKSEGKFVDRDSRENTAFMAQAPGNTLAGTG